MRANAQACRDGAVKCQCVSCVDETTITTIATITTIRKMPVCAKIEAT